MPSLFPRLPDRAGVHLAPQDRGIELEEGTHPFEVTKDPKRALPVRTRS